MTIGAQYIYSFMIEFAAVLHHIHSFPTRRSSDLAEVIQGVGAQDSRAKPLLRVPGHGGRPRRVARRDRRRAKQRSEEHTSELQSRLHLVCRLLLEKKKKRTQIPPMEVLVITPPYL